MKHGQPLGVVEANEVLAVDAEAGRTQARLYWRARLWKRCLIGVRLSSDTNGFAVWIWSDSAEEPPRRIQPVFYSPESLEYLQFKAAQRQPLAALAPKSEIAGRLYLVEVPTDVRASAFRLATVRH